MMGEQKANKLYNYLQFAGILTCNVNPYLPSLSDIGCEWCDATALIDSHGLFYTKVYRKRTAYLSNEVYFLLSKCFVKKPLDEHSGRLYELIKESGPSDTETLKILSCMEQSHFKKAFDFLLENLYITAFQNGKMINPNWSTFLYSTAEAWEKAVRTPIQKACSAAKLKNILKRTMPEKELIFFMKKCR